MWCARLQMSGGGDMSEKTGREPEEVQSQALREASARLEHRTAQLEASAKVGRAITSIFDMDELLRQTVSLISDYFGFYHAGIFLLDEPDSGGSRATWPLQDPLVAPGPGRYNLQ